MKKYKYPEHAHPHGINHPENPYRIWVCEDCYGVFTDEEAREARGGCVSCEGHLESYMPSPKTSQKAEITSAPELLESCEEGCRQAHTK